LELTVMSKRTADLGERCPVRTAIAVLGGKWKPLVVYYLRTGTKRFSELRRAIPEVTQQVLTQQLRELEDDGIVTRTVYPVVPPKVEYNLTVLGGRLGPVFDLLESWGGELISDMERHARRDTQDCLI
jgi:DNA-binding HxlR family transcriptional regulator